MEQETKRYSVRVDVATDEKIEHGCKKIGCRSKAEFIEKAVQFYYGYITAEDGREYFPQVIVSTMKGVLGTMENRMAGLLFKEAVTNAMMLHVLAATHKIDPGSINSLRGLCIDEVKRINGTLSMEDVVRYQSE